MPRAWASLAVASEAALSWTWLTTLEQSDVAELAHVGHWAARTQIFSHASHCADVSYAFSTLMRETSGHA